VAGQRLADHGDEVSVDLVAEVGSNHNGNGYTAMMLIDEAAKAGATTVKFQHYPDARYGPNSMPRNWLHMLDQHAKNKGVGFLCSVFDQRTLEEYVAGCQPTMVKIASPELTDHRLLHAAADAGLHIVLSTGMSTIGQIYEAWDLVRSYGVDSTLLHCLSSYPAPPDELNLLAMTDLSHYGNYGLSDHTLDPVVAPVTAVALGATMIEKHFTLNRGQDGPDHSYAVDPAGFKQMVDAVRLCEQMLGDGVKRVMPSEDPDARRTEEWRAA
jgi:N,N'-diacetyllegionaminate synthase